jgi:hypothetical protein
MKEYWKNINNPKKKRHLKVVDKNYKKEPKHQSLQLDIAITTFCILMILFIIMCILLK